MICFAPSDDPYDPNAFEVSVLDVLVFKATHRPFKRAYSQLGWVDPFGLLDTSIWIPTICIVYDKFSLFMVPNLQIESQRVLIRLDDSEIYIVA